MCTYFDENFLNLVPAEHVEGLYGCLDYYRDVTDPFSDALLAQYDERFPGSATVHCRQRVLGHVPGAEALGSQPSPRPARCGRRTSSRRSTTPASPRAPAARRRWFPVSTICG